MIKEDYKAIGEILGKNIMKDGDLSPKIVKELADYFEKEYKYFSRKQFYKWSGV